MIEISKLSKTYDNKVLDEISFNLYPGNIYILKGISGSGKSTLLNIISGLDSNYEGSCKVNNRELKELSKKERDKYRSCVGLMQQKSLLYHNLTIKENLLLVEQDECSIENLAKKLNVEKILNKYPDQVSGGERQRVSLIRALLGNNKIILLDEATSNLDLNNSKIFIEYLKKIDIKDKILLIATHKQLFDKLANAILIIEFGKVRIIKKNISIHNCDICTFDQKKHNNMIKYAIKNKTKQNIILKLFSIILFFISFLSLSINLNFKDEYIKYKTRDLPYLIIDVYNEYLNEINDFVIKRYDNYYYEEGKNNVYALFDKEDSSVASFIKYGYFPQSDDQILINNEYAKQNFSNINYSKILNKEILLNGKTYKITGILDNSTEILPLIYNTNCYYEDIYVSSDMTYEQPAIFMLYDEIKLFGKIMPTKLDETMVKIDEPYLLDIYNGNLNKNMAIFNSRAVSQYSIKVDSLSTDIRSVTQASLITVIVLLFLSSLFLANQTNMELHYRKKEIGYLQLWHFSKDDISIYISFQYLFEYFVNLFMSFLGYLLVCFFANWILEFNLLMNWIYIAFILFVLLFYIFIIVNIPLNNYLKKDILSLIR